MKKIVKTLVASVAAILLLLSCVHISNSDKQDNVSCHEQEAVDLCFQGDDWENS